MLSSHPQGNVGGSSPCAIPRLMCTPSHPAEPLPASRILPSLEVRGTHVSRMTAIHRTSIFFHTLACGRISLTNVIFSLWCRMSDTPMKSASTRSSRSAWPRWTSSAPPRTALAATKHVDFVICVCAVRTAGRAAGYVHRRYTETAYGPPFMALGTH